MGDAFTNVGAPSFAVNLQGTNPFADVTVVKDGTAAARSHPTTTCGAQTDGQIVWASPMSGSIQ